MSNIDNNNGFETKKNTKSGAGALAIGKSEVLKVPPNNLHVPEDWNVRDDTPEYQQHIEELAQSIAEVGVKEPLRAYYKDGKLTVTNGFSRLKAVKIAEEKHGVEIKSVPVLLEDRYASEADYTLTMLTSNSGRPLTTLEQGKVYKLLMGYGWTEEEIAKKSGINVQTVVRALDFQSSPEHIKDMVRSGKVSATLAINTLREAKGNTKKAGAILEQAVEQAEVEGKAKATAKHVERVQRTASKAVNKQPDDFEEDTPKQTKSDNRKVAEDNETKPTTETKVSNRDTFLNEKEERQIKSPFGMSKLLNKCLDNADISIHRDKANGGEITVAIRMSQDEWLKICQIIGR